MAQQFAGYEVVRLYGYPLNRRFDDLESAKSWAESEGLLAYAIFGKHVGVYGSTKLVEVPWTPAVNEQARNLAPGSVAHPQRGRLPRN